MHLTTLLSTLSIASTAVAVCPGYNWAVGSMQTHSDGVNTWTVYDSKCKATEKVTSKGNGFNVCTAGTFGCDESSPPVINKYTSAKNKLIYDCRPDTKAGNCGDDTIAVCCRNDGDQKNLPDSLTNGNYESDMRAKNSARPSCDSADACIPYCKKATVDNPTVQKNGLMSTCNTGVCTCSASPGPIVAEMLIGIGETACVVWDEAIPAAMKILSFVVPYTGAAAPGAKGLFKAAGKVFKQGSKHCANVCPGVQYTVVDPKDIGTQLGLLDCGIGKAREGKKRGEMVWVA